MARTSRQTRSYRLIALCDNDLSAPERTRRFGARVPYIALVGRKNLLSRP